MTRTPAASSAGAELRRRLVGQRQEDDVGFVRERLVIERRQRPVPHAVQAPADAAPPTPRSTTSPASADRRMARQDAEQLLAGVAAGAGDRDPRGRRRRPCRRWLLERRCSMHGKG